MPAPLAVMYTLKVMDESLKEIDDQVKFPAVDMDNIVFIKMTKEQQKSVQGSGLLEQLGNAAIASGKVFVFIPMEASIVKIGEKWEPMKVENFSKNKTGLPDKKAKGL